MANDRSEAKTSWELASEWFARTLAIVVVMVAPGAFGGWIDGRLGTSIFAVIGFGLGMITALGMLLLYTRISANSAKAAQQATDQSASGTPVSKKMSAFEATTDRPGQLPSQTSLPKMPGAEIHEPRQHE